MRSSELLQTKLQRPRIPRHIVLRPRLLARLDQGLQGPLTLVCASAGYGKTTLVSSWIEGHATVTATGSEAQARVPAAWVSLDESDSDLGLFLRYFIAGVRTIFADACAATARLLPATRRPPPDHLYATLINEIAGLPQDFILVLDDYHLIGGTAVPDLLNALERHWPQPLHLVLISRHVPALSQASMHAKGQLTEIRTRDLRFTPDEAAVYLQQVLARPLSRPDIDLLDRHTEGWIAGLQLAGLSLQAAEDPENLLAILAGLDAEFTDYLAQDVLSRQPGAILAFLLQTAIVDRFCVELCAAMTAGEESAWDARRCIDWLDRHNLFVTALDGHREWYKYHQIFRTVLLRRAQEEMGAERVGELQRRAATWFAQQGQVDEAVGYAIAAGDLDLAARAIAQGLCDVLNREDRSTLERWLGLFPDEFVQEHPTLLIVRGFSLSHSWQLGALAKLLPRTAALLEQAPLSEAEPRVLHGCLALLSASVAYFGNDPDRTVAYCREALARLPEAWIFARSGSMVYQGVAMQARGEGQAAVRLLAESYESRNDRTDTYALRILLGVCLVNYMQADDLEYMGRTAQKLVEGAAHNRLSLLQSWGHYLLGLAHYQRNELALARQSFTRLLEFTYTGNIGALRDGVQRLALIHQLAGEPVEAEGMLQFLVQLDLEQMGLESDETRALRARLWLMQGNLASAARWADDFTLPALDRAWPWHDPPHLIKARILVRRGTAADVQSALEMLDALYAVVERTHNKRLRIEILAQRGLALAALDKAEDARDTLLAAVALARPGGFVRPFADLGPPMAEALSHLAGQENFPGDLHRLPAEFGNLVTAAAAGYESAHHSGQGLVSAPTPGANGNLPPLIEPLTPRELEVLLLLRDPLSLKEIAQRLFISYLTVRRHTANIYGKLGVNQRRTAVSKAESLRLIPPR